MFENGTLQLLFKKKKQAAYIFKTVSVSERPAVDNCAGCSMRLTISIAFHMWYQPVYGAL